MADMMGIIMAGGEGEHRPETTKGSESIDTLGCKPSDTVSLNMNDLTGDSLIKIYDIVREDSEGEENIEAAKHINEYLRIDRGL